MLDKNTDKYIKNGINISETLMPKEDGDPWKKSSHLLEKLIEARDNKKPFSMVRYGDGEGRILGYPLYYNDQEITHQVLTYQYGTAVIPLLKNKYQDNFIFKGIMDLKYGIIEAARNADIIGLPSWLHFRYMDEKNKNAMLAQSLCHLELERFLGEKDIFDHYIFRKFQMDNYFNDLLNGVDFLGVVSHSNINELLQEKFNINEVIHYKIAGHQSFMKDNEPQYPDAYLRLISEIKVPYEGAMFIVAAGYLGKIYCNEIKKKGGMAIDIGAIFDAWTGIGRANETKNEHLRL